jgi:hypothetical protein
MQLALVFDHNFSQRLFRVSLVGTIVPPQPQLALLVNMSWERAQELDDKIVMTVVSK